MKQIIASSSAPGAIGPYSQAVRAGNSLYISGQIPIDPATGEFAGNDIVTQTRQSLKNIGEILKAAGMDYGDVVKTTVLLQSIGDFAEMNREYASFLKPTAPPAPPLKSARCPRARSSKSKRLPTKSNILLKKSASEIPGRIFLPRERERNFSSPALRPGQYRHFTHRSTKRFFLLSVRSIWSSRSSTSASASVRSSPVSQWGLKAAFSKSSVIRPRESPH